MQKIDKTQIDKILSEQEFILIDQKVKDLYFKNKLPNAFVLDNPESQKSIDAYSKIVDFFITLKIRRNSTLYVIGGGATSDIGGFVASTILRGIEWVVIPTTLLAMVDASIGGKTGLNTSFGKNQIGSFHLPKEIYFNFDFLKTLSLEDRDSGHGEIIKYLFLNPKLEAFINSNDLILNCANYKQSLVELDFKETTGKRSQLNFGHTAGHAIEILTQLPHGIAVLYGIEFELMIFQEDRLESFYSYIKHFNIQLNRLKLNRNKFLELISYDKKNKKDLISFIVDKKEIFITAEELNRKIDVYAKNFFE